MHGQSAIEFLTTYSWAFIILSIFVATVLAIVISPSRQTPTRLPESCYITPTLPCFESLVLLNSSAAKFIVILQNNMGVGLYFQPNGIIVEPSYFSNKTYVGACYPQNAIPGSTVICNTTLSGFGTVVGAQLNPKFTLNYKLCTPTCSAQVYNTTGTAIVVAAPYRSAIFSLSLLDSPANGRIALQGVKYASGTKLTLIRGLSYPVYALVPNSLYMFGSWNVSGSNITLSSLAQSTSLNVTGNGTLKANFVLTTSTTTSISTSLTTTFSTTSTSTTSTSTTSTSTTSTSTTSTSTSTTSIVWCYDTGADSCSGGYYKNCTYQCLGAGAACYNATYDCKCAVGTTVNVVYSGSCQSDRLPCRIRVCPT